MDGHRVLRTFFGIQSKVKSKFLYHTHDHLETLQLLSPSVAGRNLQGLTSIIITDDDEHKS